MSEAKITVNNASSPGVQGRLESACRDLAGFIGDCTEVEATDHEDFGECIKISKGPWNITIYAGGNHTGYGDPPYLSTTLGKEE
jgi:hypothetical protein